MTGPPWDFIMFSIPFPFPQHPFREFQGRVIKLDKTREGNGRILSYDTVVVVFHSSSLNTPTTVLQFLAPRLKKEDQRVLQHGTHISYQVLVIQ